MNNRARKLREMAEPGSWIHDKYVVGFDKARHDRYRWLVAEVRRLQKVLKWEKQAEAKAFIRRELAARRSEAKVLRRELRENIIRAHSEWIDRAEWAECTRQCWSASDEEGYDECECRCLGEFHGLLRVKELAVV